MYFSQKFLLSTFFLAFLLTSNLQSQVYLQLERFNNPKALKFGISDKLEYKLKEYPDQWKTDYILDLKADEQLLVFEHSYYHLQDLKAIRLRYPAIKGIGTKLMQFGGVWYVFGGLGTVTISDYTMSQRELVIGAGFAATGFLLKSLFYKKTVRVGKRKRLRVVDLRFKVGAGY
jgi:hypothetical protein